MKTTCKLLVFLTVLSLVAQSHAQETSKPASASNDIQLYKDPLVAVYFSATLPGLGQFYTAKKQRGFLFLAGIVASLGTAYAAYEPADLELPDYDTAIYGGNNDGQLSIVEYQNWKDQKYQDDAFSTLSSSRKTIAITGGLTGLGLYIWNIIDAHHQAKNYNQKLAQRKMDLGQFTRPDLTGLALNLHF